ncbi:n-acetylgalactosamine-alpha-r beta 1 3-galactosyltransferase [Paragonimus westermani]|uniref:N-acetylgalactosamine-alpha-r beta 1 3-galactosyltransferase n=1 Tax=Paragonimus westermani TaxID=34504 RepID=A0A8T0DRR7_9TREM|nr:n-acetylgalactosamine-alpha-r beta 1 3-galactosyltransferase [Paragonimus westermani]
MPELTELKNYMPSLESDDIFKTSYGVGHHWRPGCYFPDSETSTKCSSGETCSLTPRNEVKPVEHFQTTTGSTYDAKIMPETLKVDRFPPPPHHWDTLYISDFRSRYLAGHYHRPLSPSHQKSETHDAFQRTEGPTELWRPLSLQPFVLENHHKDGPSKKMIASNANPDLAGRIIYPKDNEILRNLDPYLSTSMKEHRMWTPEELNGLAKKDIATYWDLEDYPKARGFGLQKK